MSLKNSSLSPISLVPNFFRIFLPVSFRLLAVTINE
jgi:hypothetical protein